MGSESIVGVVPDNWDATTLGAIVDRGNGVVQTGPFGSQLHASDYIENGVPAIMPVNIGDNCVNTEGISRIKVEDADRLSRYRLRRGDIVYSRRGDIERRALIREEEDGWLCGTGCLMVRLGDDSGVHPEFAAYFLGHPAVRQWLTRHAVGATMPNLNTTVMRAVPFVLPPSSEQKGIAETLSALDDKIRLNREASKTLEAIARAIFKAWVIDFEPVKAKAAGATSFPGMPQEVFEQLPSQFGDSTEEQVPLGWDVMPISGLTEVVGGGTPSTKEPTYWEGGEFPFCTPKDMSRLTSPVLLATERALTAAGMNRVSSGQLPAGTVLLSSRAPIGYLALAGIPVSINQGIIAMPPGEVPNSYLLLWTEANMDRIKARAGGSTFAEISKSNFRAIPALRPDSLTLGAFDKVVHPLIDRIVSNDRESQILTSLRDSLLPRLISGQIRVPVADGRDDDGE